MLVIIYGQMGSGKTTLKNLFVEIGYENIKTYTTRPKRNDSEENDYIFVSTEEFINLYHENKLLEYTSYMPQGEYNGEIWLYGSPIETLNIIKDKKYVMVLNYDGILNILSRHPEIKKYLHIIKLVVPENILKERLLKRGDDEFEIKRRIEDERWMKNDNSHFFKDSSVDFVSLKNPELAFEYIVEYVNWKLNERRF